MDVALLDEAAPAPRRDFDDVSKRAEGIGKAAWMLEDTQQERLVGEYPEDPEARECYFECANAEVAYRQALFLLLIMTIAETPSWCNTGHTVNNYFGFLDPHDQCGVVDHSHRIDPIYLDNSSSDGYGEWLVASQHVLLSNIPYIPFGWGIVLEVYLISVMARKLMLEWRLQNEYFDKLKDKSGKKVVYFNKKSIYFGLACVVLEMLDCCVFILYRPSIRVAFIPRTGYLCLLPAVRQLGHCVVQVLPEFASIASFFVGMLVFYAWVVVTIFDDLLDEIPWGEGTVKVNKGLDTFSSTLYTMFVAGTTDDFVEAFLPSYTAYRSTGILWLIFLVLLQVLLLNLVLDTLVAAYNKYSEETTENFVTEKVRGVKAAFETLAKSTQPDGVDEEIDVIKIELSKTTFLDFMREFSRSPRTRPIPIKTANIIFAAVDQARFLKKSGKRFTQDVADIQTMPPEYLTVSKAIEKAQKEALCGGFWFQKGKPKEEEAEEEEKQVQVFFKAAPALAHSAENKEVWPDQSLEEDHSCVSYWKKEACGLIGVHGFVDICSVMQYDFWTTQKYSLLKNYFPKMWRSERFTRVRIAVEDGTFDTLMNIVLLFNLLLVITETAHDLNHTTDGEPEPPLMDYLELTFSLIYVGEITTKLGVLSWGQYTSDRSNIFDFITTWLLLATSVVEMLGGQNTSIKRYMNILRLLRLVRMMKGLKRLPAVVFMMNTTAKLVVRATDILTFLGVVTFFFTTLSVQLWGGLLYQGNPDLLAREINGTEFEQTAYAEENLWVLNFNDFLSAFGVWVVSLLCEYNTAFPEAIANVASVPQTWTVFGIFYLLAVSIVFELVKAFTIEVFMDLNKKKNQPEGGKKETLTELNQEFEDKGLQLHFRMLGDDSAEDLMMEKLDEMADGELSEDEGEGGKEEDEGGSCTLL